MSRKARSVIRRVLEENNGSATEQELIEAQVEERGVTENTARDYVTMYCEKTEKSDGTVECVAFGDSETQRTLAQENTNSTPDEGEEAGTEIRPVGEETEDKFAELTVLADVNHPKVPTDYETGYYRRRVVGHKSDVQIMTRMLERGKNVMLAGDTGVGKGELAKHVAANTNRPVYQFNAGEDIRVDDLIGHYELVDGDTVWIDGIVTKCAREGGLLLVDEFDAMGGAMTIMMHSLLEDDPTLTIPQTGEMLTPHEQFRVVGTRNPDYTGTQKQNRATMNRFVHIELDYISKDREVQVVLDNTELDDKKKDDIESLVEAANDLRDDYKNGDIVTPVSTRELINIGELIEDDWMDIQDAAKMVIGNLAERNDRQPMEKVLEMKL